MWSPAANIESREEEARGSVDLRESAEDAPVIKLVNQLIAQAIEQGAFGHPTSSPDGTNLRVRFRVDGVLADGHAGAAAAWSPAWSAA